MFTHLITLKKKPWYIYSTSQDDALNIVKKYSSDVVGVVLAPEGLVMQQVDIKLSLVTPDIKLIDQIVEEENLKIANEVIGEEE